MVSFGTRLKEKRESLKVLSHLQGLILSLLHQRPI